MSFIVSVASAIAAICAVFVTYLAIFRGSQPRVLIYYQASRDVPSIIDLVIENIGGGDAIDVKFSNPIPILCSNGSRTIAPELNFNPPILAAGQRYVFLGGQYGGLKNKINGRIDVDIFYKFKNPLGIFRSGHDFHTLSIEHLEYLPTRTSAAEAIVDALKGNNSSTLKDIKNELGLIRRQLQEMVKKIH